MSAILDGLGKRHVSGERARRAGAREKLRLEHRELKRQEAKAARRDPSLPTREAKPGPTLAKAAERPSHALAVGIAAVLWVASLAALVGLAAMLDSAVKLGRLPASMAWVGPFLLCADLIGTPIAALFWTYALWGQLRLTRTPGGKTFALAYHVPGKQGGAWLEVVRPRVVKGTAHVLWVTTRFGPRLLPRHLRTQDGREHALRVTDDGVRLEPRATAPKVRVASVPPVELAPPEPLTEPVVHCVECDEPGAGEGCEHCTDAVHGGPCAAQHAARHTGARAERPYR